MTRILPLLALAVLSAACARGPRRSGRECPAATAPGAGELARGYAWSRCGRLAEAISAFSAAAASDPGNKRARMELGYARQAAGDFTAAADDFALVAREPGEFQEQAQGALKALQEGGTSASDSTRQTLLDAGYEALRKGENAEAREKFKLALASDPGREEIAKQLGYMSLAEGDLAGAARDFEGRGASTPRTARPPSSSATCTPGSTTTRAPRRSSSPRSGAPTPRCARRRPRRSRTSAPRTRASTWTSTPRRCSRPASRTRSPTPRPSPAGSPSRAGP
ncbi:MAG: hypothetical protein M0D55_05375 [Elusimicrobiota bacterium]|nr:MAG: hypothetical protein M0D55_05375 [Elusimicrobiota bacterium]